MPDACCAFIKPDGDLCAAHLLPDRPFCLFHDHEQAARLADARSKGGAAPRCRRFPRLLAPMHVAELFVDALNQTDASDTRRLHALTGISRVLLKDVPAAESTSSEAAEASEEFQQNVQE